MTDIFSKEKRSWVMSRIRSRWTKQEKEMHNRLKSLKIKHRMHPKMEGNPDIILKESKTAIFLHGCFWHKCPRHYTKPQSNKKYWIPKIDKNVARDRINVRTLRRNGWRVIRIWEHELKNDSNPQIKKITGVVRVCK